MNFYQILQPSPCLPYAYKKEDILILQKYNIIKLYGISLQQAQENNLQLYIYKNKKFIKREYPKNTWASFNKIFYNYITADDLDFLQNNYHKIINKELWQFKLHNNITQLSSKFGNKSKAILNITLHYIKENHIQYNSNNINIIDSIIFLKIYNAIKYAPEWFNKISNNINYDNKEYLLEIQQKLINGELKENIFKCPTLFSIDWWLQRGWDIKYAQEKVKQIQKNNAAKVKIHHNLYDISTQMMLYNISEKEAIQHIADLKVKTSSILSTYINKYGEEEGYKRYYKKHEKWKKTMENKSSQEKEEILIKKTCIINASKISQELFFGIYEGIKDLNIKCYFAELNHEYGTWVKELNRGVLYDFVIPELKFAIEYNGSRFHPNKEKLTNEEWAKWENPFTHIGADEIYKKDTIKNNYIINQGYNLQIIWDFDYLANKKKVIQQQIDLIKQIYEKIKTN